MVSPIRNDLIVENPNRISAMKAVIEADEFLKLRELLNSLSLNIITDKSSKGKTAKQAHIRRVSKNDKKTVHAKKDDIAPILPVTVFEIKLPKLFMSPDTLVSISLAPISENRPIGNFVI
jgi:hypothetical protein